MSQAKVTHYELLPTQYDFLFGFDKEKLKGEKIYLDVSLYQGGFTCVPKDTEFLSPVGWVGIDKLTKEDELAVYYQDGSIKFEHPKEVFKWKADKWYDFNTRFIHQTLCPNHKIVYWNDKRP